MGRLGSLREVSGSSGKLLEASGKLPEASGSFRKLLGASGKLLEDDYPFIVLTETKFSLRCIPVWVRYSPHRQG